MHNYNFDAFLKSQNVPMLIRKAANSSRPVHTITHEGDRLRIQVDGITKGDTTYVINGPPSGSNIRHLKFDDYVTWVDDGQAVQVRKVAKNAPPNGAVELIVKRQLANHGHNLILTSKAKFEDGSESVESVQTFHRIH
jgi:ribosomal protein L24